MKKKSGERYGPYKNDERICLNCARTYKVERYRKQKFCSVKCGAAYHSGITLIEKECLWCKRIFKSESWRKQRFCSKECGIEFNRGKPRKLRKKSKSNRVRNREERRTKDGRRISLHRYVLEEEIGRQLLPEETVHHIDMDISNNNIRNLYLFKNESHHIRCHHSIEKLVPKLLKGGMITFKEGTYKIGNLYDGGGGKGR